MHLKIGTRSSPLALWQAHFVQATLQAGGVLSELVLIETKGDKILDRSLSKIGNKGVFTQELEDKLRAGTIDLAIHSAKDLQSSLPTDLSILAFTERERVNDVLVSYRNDVSLISGVEFVIGTSSTRRVAMLKHVASHIRTVDMRGNLQTRLRKLQEGHCDALLLAYAGIHRMGYDALIVEHLPIHEFIPAVGQGSIAVEVSENLSVEKQMVVRRLINHAPTEFCLLAERAFLCRLEGGCSIPVFGLATLEDHQLTLTGGIVSLDGSRLVRETVTGPVVGAEHLGHSLAEHILTQGGDEILRAIAVANGSL